MPYLIIVWRAPGAEPYFFRGDNRYELYLPQISSSSVSRGWVRDERYARIFDGAVEFTSRTCSPTLNVSRLKVYPYEKPLLPTQIFRPLRRPRHRPPY